MSEKDEDYSLSAIFEALLCTVAVPPNSKKPHTSSPREGRDGFEVTEENGSGSGSRRPTDSSSEGEVIGEEIGRFHATKVLGTGAFSVVRMGRHNITRRRVALKIMSKKRIVAMGAQQHVAREIWHTRLVSAHPHLAKLYDVIDTPTSTVLAMEFVMGGELLNYMNNHALPPDEARKFFQQIVSGLEFIHGKGVVHRDLKLENILLDASRTKVKIVDFGLSNMVRDGELMVTNCGSPRHAAPEVICGRPYAGPPVDVWSSGVILYSMLVGQLPFQGDVDDDLYRRIQSGKFWVPPYLTYGMKALVEGMICVDVAKRLTIQQIKGMDWFKRDLPQYLRRTPEETEREERHTVDQAVVEEVLTLYDMHSVEPVKRHEVEDAANAEDLTVEVNADGEKRLMKDLQLAYRLVLDGERAKQMHIKKKISKRTATRGKGKKKLTNLLLRGKFM